MPERVLLVGEWRVSADIDDTSKPDWRGVISQPGQAPPLSEGNVQIVLLGSNGEHVGASRARVVPGGGGQPTALEGLEPFQ